MMDDSRFDRLEKKIDKLTDAVTKIVRVEEKLVAHDQRVDRLEKRVDKHDEAITALAEIARENKGVAKFADKLFWIFIGGFVGLFFWMFKQ
jgi:predicted RNase H-like nuclease (RuvC/YqgF family)